MGNETPDAPNPIQDVRDAYAKGWEDACALAIVRFNTFAECSFSADEAIEELMRMAETGAHHSENRADGQ
jgi:hypothetical protein